MKLVSPPLRLGCPNHSTMSTSAPPLAAFLAPVNSSGWSQNEACWPLTFWNFIRAAATP